jgi:hypothetical protein
MRIVTRAFFDALPKADTRDLEHAIQILTEELVRRADRKTPGNNFVPPQHLMEED